MFQPNREELAWAAGFLDGEGFIGSRRAPKRGDIYRDLVVQITQAEPTTLERFRKAVGVGAIYGPYPNRRLNQRDCWQYKAGTFSAQAVLAMLWGFLSPVKKAQAATALQARKQYLQHPTTTRTRQGRHYD